MHSLNTMFRINQQRADEARRAKLQREAEATAAANARYEAARIKPLDVLFNEYEEDILKPQAA